jgi:hypothetical protein
LKIKEVAFTKYDENSPVELPPLFITKALIGTDMLLGFLKDKKPEAVEAVVDNLMERLSEMEMHEGIEEVSFEYERKHLPEYPELETTMKKVILGHLRYEKYRAEFENEKVRVSMKDYVRSYLPITFSVVAALAESMPREEALELYREFVDFRTDKVFQWKVNDLSKIHEQNTSKEAGPQKSFGAILEDGRVVSRVDRCMWKEILEPYGDPELAYHASCYLDFHVAELMNPNFMLTRTKTVMQGDKYCDFCWHDKHIDKTLEHPSEEFWDGLGEITNE